MLPGAGWLGPRVMAGDDRHCNVRRHVTPESKCNTMIAGGVWAAAWVSGSCGGAGHIACARALPWEWLPAKKAGLGFLFEQVRRGAGVWSTTKNGGSLVAAAVGWWGRIMPGAIRLWTNSRRRGFLRGLGRCLLRILSGAEVCWLGLGGVFYPFLAVSSKLDAESSLLDTANFRFWEFPRCEKG